MKPGVFIKIRSTFVPNALLPLFLCLILSSCATGGIDTDPNRIVVAIESTPGILDPRFETDAQASRIDPLIYSRLFYIDPDCNIAPDLARTLETPDPLTYVVKIRDDAVFHDGRRLTSDDVRFTFEFVKNPENLAPSASEYELLKSIETPDATTVVFHLSEPFPPFIHKLKKGIVPRHLVESRGKDFAEQPVGSGPFVFESMAPGEYVRLRANRDYYGGVPRVEEVLFRVIANDTTRMLELKKGGIDLIQNALPPYALKFFDRQEGLKIVEAEGVNYSYMGFNLEDPVLSDVRVREAISRAIDRETIIRYSLKGTATPATGVISPLLWAHNPDLPRFDYDPAYSKQLLDEAGHPDPDGDGPALRMSFSYKTSTNKLANEIAEVIREQLRQVGIGMEKRSYEWGTFFADIKSGNFTLYTLTWVGLTDPDFLSVILHSNNVPPKGANRGRYSNPAVDRLLDASRVETDQSERKRIYGEVQRLAAEDLVYVSLWHHRNVVVMKEGITGFEIYPLGDYISLKDVHVDGGERG